MTPEQEETVLERLKQLEDALAQELSEAKHERRELRKDVTCLVNTWSEFQHRHGKLLDLLLEREETRRKVSSAIIEKSFAGLVWGFIVFVGVAAWEWARNHIR